MDSRNVTTDFKVPPAGETLAAIFSKQKELAEEYVGIEGMPPAPWDVNNAEHQIWIKDFFWRVIEELCEALEIKNNLEGEDKPFMHDPLFLEEIADALHFLIEPMVMMNWSYIDLECNFQQIEGKTLNVDGMLEFYRSMEDMIKSPIEQIIGSVMYQLGLAGNCLKNKKWKQSQVLTDQDKFRKSYILAFLSFLLLCAKLGMTAKGLYLVYMKKAEVNEFRQRTKY
jgi:dimeric dUTPase (all-alpha-NTP-PPase superfamily)